MSKVCIVGSSGYLGSKILLSLKKKFKIISVSRKKIYQKNFNEGLFKSIIGDIRSKKTINKIVSQKPEYIIFASGFNHFRSEKNFKKTINNNNDSLLSLCENISKNENFKKIIYLSSFQVYGNYQENELINEKTPKNPKNFYGLSHSINEDILNIAKNKFKINFEIIRLTNAYGYPSLITNDCWWLVINDLCKNYVFKKKIVINSDGNPFRNFIHLNDVAEFIKLLLYKKKKTSEIYNLASNETIQIKRIAKKIYEVSNDKKMKLLINKKEIHNFQNLKFEQPSFKISTNKIKKLGFKPKKNLNMGIKTLLNEIKIRQSKNL